MIMTDPIREEQPASTEQPQEPPSKTLPWWERELSPDERRAAWDAYNKRLGHLADAEQGPRSVTSQATSEDDLETIVVALIERKRNLVDGGAEYRMVVRQLRGSLVHARGGRRHHRGSRPVRLARDVPHMAVAHALIRAGRHSTSGDMVASSTPFLLSRTSLAGG
jgi:hypothetical protein